MLPKIWLPKKRDISVSFSNEPVQSLTRTLVLLGSKDLFIAFSNGVWLLYSTVKDKILNKGEVEHVVWDDDFVLQSPHTFGQHEVLYMNFSTHRLECLNPYTGELDLEWNRTILKEKKSTSFEKFAEDDDSEDAVRFQHAAIEVLNLSKQVGIIELVDYQNPYNPRMSRNYLFKSYARGSKKPIASFVLPWNEQKLFLSKGNEEDLFVFWSPTHLFYTYFHLFSTKQKERGLIEVSFENDNTFFKPTLYGCFPWQQDEIILFGQAETEEFPSKYLYNYKLQKFQTAGFSHRREEEPLQLQEVSSIDPTKKNILITESVGSSSRNIVLFNDRAGQADAIYSFPTDRCHIGDAEGGMIVEYEKNISEDSTSKNIRTELTISRAVTLEIFLLFMLKQAKNSQGESFLQFYGNVYLAKGIAQMLRKY